LSFHTAKHPIGVGSLSFIYKTSHSDFWYFRYWVNSEKKYVRVSLRTKDFTEAKQRGEKRYLELIGQIHSGEKVFSITAEEQVRRFLSYQESRYKSGDATHRQLSRQQYDKYRYVMRLYLRFVLPQTLISSIKPSDFVEYLNFRRAETPPPSFLTIKEEQTIIGSLFSRYRDKQIAKKLLSKKVTFNKDGTATVTEKKQEGSAL